MTVKSLFIFLFFANLVSQIVLGSPSSGGGANSVSSSMLPREVSSESGSHTFWLGHNLSQTSYVPMGGELTFGTQAAGVGILDKVFVATSPWLYMSYNMNNVFVKATTTRLRENNVAFTYGYFKTAEFYPSIYVMEAHSFWAIKTFAVTDVWRAHVNLNYMYFADETIPFSLRREPFNDEPWQISLTSLNELMVSRHVVFGAEFGVLGMNYTYPHLHVGASVQYRNKNWLAQLGVSGSSQARMAGSPYTQQQATTVGSGRQARRDSTTHPEVQIQYYW